VLKRLLCGRPQQQRENALQSPEKPGYFVVGEPTSV
jgi:hypothetical protein